MLVAHLEEMHDSLGLFDVLRFLRDWKLPE